MTRRPLKVWLLEAIAALLLAALAAAPLALQVGSAPPTPAQAVQQAWQRAHDLGAYRFTTDLTAIAYPAPSLANTGRAAREERLHMEGSVDLPARTLLLSLWQGAGSVLNPGDGVEVRIEGDRAYGRQTGGRWQEIDDFSGGFAPGGDLLVYLAGAKNVVELGTQTLILPQADEGRVTNDDASPSVLRPSSFVKYTRYGFDLDGPAVAEEVRRQWQDQLLKQGGLPAGVEAQAPAQLRDAAGHGELWVDGDGLPVRITLEIAYPPEAGDGGAGGRATIRTDLSGFPALEVAQAPRWAAALGLGGLSRLAQPDRAGWPVSALDARRMGAQAALFLAMAGLALLVVLNRRSRRVYLAIVLVIVLSMVVTPLAESQRLATYGQQQAARRAAYEQRQGQARTRQDLQEAMHTNQWDPSQDPLATGEQSTALGDPSGSQEGSGQPGTGEAPAPLLGPYQVTEVLQEEPQPDPESDLDGDTLTYVEEQRLGTNPDEPDSDNDCLRDDLEVKGFVWGTARQYSDPLNADTNNDGVGDLKECWIAFPGTDPPWNQACDLNTDGDAEPDIFDGDNDNDGVPDGVDLSPFSSMGSFSNGNPFQLKLDDLATDVLTLVDLQIRPTNVAQLTYAFNVLDWPSDDTEGQVQDVLDTTFADSMTDEEIANDPRSANGDLRLIPMLEIKVPYKQGHTRNLPVQAGWSGTLGMTTPELEEWVDMEVLDQYGVTVRYADEAGNLVIYAPLSLVSDDIGGASVAFTTRVPYQMMVSGDWGNAHQVRFIWALQMLVDQCKEVPEGEDGESWCAEPENRSEEVQIVQTYYEPWVLSGLSVREDHGVDLLIAYEDPAHDTDKEDDQNLWALANGLDQTWIAARDCDTLDAAGNCVGNNQRDLTIAEIKHRFDNASNGDIPTGDARLWNIPKTAIKMFPVSVEVQDLLAAVPMTYTKEVLNQNFLKSGAAVTEAPLLMFIREERYRIATLDSAPEVVSRSGSLLTVNMAPELVSLDTLAAMSWMPYRYRDGAWEPYPTDEYVAVLDPRLQESFPVDTSNPDGQAISDGQVITARGYFLGMEQGTEQVVQTDGEIHPQFEEEEEEESRDEELKEESIEVAGEIVLVIVEVAGVRLSEFAYFLWGSPKFSSLDDVWIWLGAVNQDIQARGGFTGWDAAGASRAVSVFNKIGIATLITSTVFSVVLFLVSIGIESDVLVYIQDGLQVAAGVLRFTAGLGKLILEVSHAAHEAGDLVKGYAHLWHQGCAGLTTATAITLVVAIVVETLVALAVFIYAWAASNVMIGSLAWDQMLVDMIARIVVSALIWALSFIPVIGEILYLLITVLDAIAGFICSFLSEEQQQSTAADWLCGGISSILANIFSWLFYGQNVMVDIEDEERWQVGTPTFELGDPAKGIAVGNTLGYQLTLTNSIRLTDIPVDWKAACYAWQYNDDNLKQSTFGYTMSTEEEGELHGDLSLGQQSTKWIKGPKRGGKQTYHQPFPLETEEPGVALNTAGINITSAVYVHEGYALPVQECIAVPFWALVPICWIRDTKATNPADLGEYFPWDVFPETLDKFYEKASVDGGYSLAWGQSGNVRFGRQKDFDGDTLVNAKDGGPDPDDGKWDADGDGLSDNFERQIGTDPESYDPDIDGLSDRDELLLGTDPYKADSDGDGLTDRQERDGWEFAYGFDSAGKPKMFWVTSDPLRVDGDGDTLTDLQEYNYRYNPRAAEDPNVLGFTSELSEVSSSGSTTPSDGLVKPGDKVRYEATVENKTMLSSAQGLHQARLPAGRLSGSVASRTFLLYPQEKKTLSGDLSVVSGIASGPADLVQTAGARITYALADSDYAQLVLHLEDASTATTFADSSGNIPPHNGQCTGTLCPARQVDGYMGKAVQFDATKQQKIEAPDVDISAGSLGLSFWFKTSSTNVGLFSSTDGSVNVYVNSTGHVCAYVKAVEPESNLVYCSTDALNDNKWHQAVLTVDNGEYAALDIDGWSETGEGSVSDDHYTFTRANPTAQSGVRLGYSASTNTYLTGFLDDVVVYDRALTDQEINSLYGRPLFAAHLDEASGVTTFKEDGGLSGTCSGTACPTAGKAGALGKSASFDGGDNIKFGCPNPGSRGFTLAAWVLPTGSQTATQGIVGMLSNPLYGSYATLLREGTGIKAIFGCGTNETCKLNLVSGALTLNAWNHVVLAYGPSEDGSTGYLDLYVNGLRRGGAAFAGYPWAKGQACIQVGDVWGASGGYVDPTYPANPFTGQIDEVLLYPYGLSGAQVDELHRNQADALHLPLDEPPGTYQFQDALARATASCPADSATCPTAGVAGRSGQAAEFDGTDDTLDAGTGPAISGTGPLTVAAWVRTTATKDQVIIQQRSGNSADGEYQLRLTADGKVYWMTWASGGAAKFDLYSTKAVKDGKWHHVAGVRGEDGSARIYIDGTEDGSLGATTPIASLTTTNVYVGANVRAGVQYFSGAIDEVHVVRRALSGDEVKALVYQAPRLLLHLEEVAGASTFADDTELGNNASCQASAGWCPDAGVKGQVNLAAGFDGVDDRLGTTYKVPDSGDLTLMAWVKPDSTSSGRHMVLGWNAYQRSLPRSLFRDGETWHVGTGGTPEDWNTGAEVQVGTWQHVGVVYSGNTARFFLNGHPTGSQTLADVRIPTGSVGLGYDLAMIAGSFWDGRIDEVAIYERALSDSEIESLWLYQGEWVQETHTTPLRVDNDNPTSDLVSESPYRPNQPVNLLIQTSDATSTVTKAQWKVDNGAWMDAPPCDTDLGATWCPTFDPTAFHGEGVYTIHTQATDAAGNVSATSSDTLYVDGTAPTVTTTSPQNEALLKLTPVPDLAGTFKLSIEGTVNEPAVTTGVPGSGLRSVKVTLLDAYRRPAGDGTHLAEVKGTSWYTAVTLTDPIASGAYIIQVEADDQVGNIRSTDTATIYLDWTGPEATLEGLPAGGAILALHLDEAAGATQFADGSGYGHNATCGTACPTAGVTGKYAKAVDLNGTSQSLAVSDALDFGAGDFTLAAWFQTTSQSWQTIAAASTTGSPAQDVVLLQVTNGGKVRFTFAPSAPVTTLTSPRAFHDGQWHQAAAVRQGSELLLYVDGEIVATKSDSRALSGPLRLAVGQHSSTEFFKGRLDEVYVVPVALSGTDAYNLSIPYLTWDVWLEGVVSEVPLIDGAVMELHLEETYGELFADSSAYANDATCSGTTCPVRVTTGTFFGQALKFDGVDDRLSVPNSSALWSLQDNWTLSAWIQPDRLSGDQQIVAYPQGSTGFGFGTHGAGLRFSAFGVGTVDTAGVALKTGAWQQVGMSLSGGDLTFYVDGVAREVITDTKLLQPNLTETDSLYVGMTAAAGGSTPAQPFQGSIDEVLLFNRALARDEVLQLAAKKHAGVSTVDMAVVPASPGSALYNAPMPAGTQLYLPFDDTESASGALQFLDISGQGRTVSCSGAYCPTVGHSGHAGGAALFDGQDDRAATGNWGTFTTVTAAAWVQRTGATTSRETILSYKESAGCGFVLSLNESGGLQYPRFFVRVGSSWLSAEQKVAIPAGEWVHLAGAYDGQTIRLYRDGQEVASQAAAGTMAQCTADTAIGSHSSQDKWYFPGLIDEVVVLDHAATGDQVRSLYLGTEPVLRLRLDESWAADGSTLADSSRFRNDGTLHGATTDHAVAGAVGSGALQLNGSSDYLTTARSIDFARGDYSVSAWVRTSAKAQQVLFSATNPTGDTPGIQLYLDSSGVLHWLHRAPTGSSGGTDLVCTGPALNYGQWEHVAAVKQGTTLTLYHAGWPYATGTASSGFTHALDITLGRQGKTTAGAYWNGALDDVRVYARALSAEELEDLLYNEPWDKASPSPTGAGVVRSKFTMSPNNYNVEGYYRIDLRSTDTFDNRTDTGQSWQLWNGVFDNIYPRAELKYRITTVGSSQQVHYEFSAHDFTLVENGFVSPCPAGTSLTREYFNAPWYRAWTGEAAANSDRLWALSGQCDLAYSGTLAKLTVCDASGLCTTVSAKPLAAAAAPQAGGGVLILEPAEGTLLNGTAPVQISGGAFSPDFLKRLTVRADHKVIDNSHWQHSAVTDATWTTAWPPDGEGPHLIDATLHDWAGGVYTDTVTVILDTQPPQVAIATTVLTTTHRAGGRVTLSGTASDANGLTGVEVEAGGVWRPAIVSDGAWTVAWVPDLGTLPDGQTLSVVARATDRAGWTTLAAGDVQVDVVVPAPVDLALSYQAGGATQPITQTGTTIREPGSVVEMAWSASSDGSGLAGYRAGWTAVDAGGSATDWTEVSPGGARRASTTSGEAQKLTASLGSRDAYGNTTWQGFGPIYADGPLTPDYTALDDPEGTYHGWMDSGCALLGVDRRLGRIAPDLAMRHGEQTLYATWDDQALRLAWSGANWSADGDLFVYLDTVPGGSTTVFNPFTSTHTLSEAMSADYGVWVRDAQTAYLLSWDGSAWITSTLQTGSQLHYQPKSEGGLTDLRLPFDLLGIGDPAANPLGLLAFASEEGALRLWAVLPRANPVTSRLATGSTGHTLEAPVVPLTHTYRWPSLGARVCPNGSRALAAGQTPYPDADLQVRLAADPAGIVYGYLGDHLFPWAGNLLLGKKPADFSGLLSFLDLEHPLVHDGQTLRYTLHVQNSGRATAHNVAARVWADNALTLPGGAPLAGPERRYYQEVAIGDLAPGEARDVSLEGKVSLAWAQPLYEACLAAQPDRPHACEQFLHWALLTVHIVDQTHSAATGPLERMWADHRVDFAAPRFVGITQPGLYIPAGGVALRGYAYDDSGVPKLTLRVQTPGGGTVSLPCANPAPASGAWSCTFDPTAANGGAPPQDGQTFRIRLRGTDAAGLTGDMGPWLPFIVDTVPPTVTAQLPMAAATGLPASVRTFSLTGRLADNHGAAGVEVCLEGKCRSALVALERPPRQRVYADGPGAPVPLPGCGSGEVRRSFTVTDTFAIRSVGLGLRADHPNRAEIRAELISPHGTRVRVLPGEGELGSTYQGYAVLLADAAAAALSQLGLDQDPAAPGFPHAARPYEPLSALIGEGAAGTWTLVLCDTDPAADAGSYLGSHLFLQPQDTGARNGTWSQRLTVPELDGVEQTVAVYGLDDAGNRTTEPFTHTFVVDNVAPEIGITHVISEVQMTPDLAPMGVLSGIVADGDRVRRLFAVVHTPEGRLRLQPVARDGQNWSFALRAATAGVHTIHILAEDLAGNQTIIGPVAVEVRGILVEEQAYLPVILQRAMGGMVQEQLWLPVVLKGAGEAEEQEPEAPELPAPSATAAVTPTLTLTPMVTVTVTVTVTQTQTLTPTATITPTLAGAP